MIEIPMRIGDTQHALRAYMSLYRTPFLGLKEYITNAAEAGLRNYEMEPSVGNHSNISITVNKKQGILIVQDGGRGISSDQMKQLPQNIHNSMKRTLLTPGEKAIGILGFGSAQANQVEFYSIVPELEDAVNYLCIDKSLENARFDQLDRRRLKHGGSFEQGTRIVLSGFGQRRKNSEAVIDAYFSASKLIPLLSETYGPLIRRGLVDIIVTYESGTRSKILKVEPPKYEGQLICDEKITLEGITLKNGAKGPGHIHLFLFVNPRGKIEKVGHYNWGVRVSSSIASSLMQLSKHTWESGRMTGEVYEDILKLTEQRDAVEIVDDTGNLEKVIDELLGVEPYLNIQTQKIKQQQDKHALDTVMRQMLKAFEAVFDDMEQAGAWVRGRQSDQTRNVSPTGAIGYPETSRPREPRSPKPEPPVPSPGGGFPLLTDNPLGDKEPVRPGRRSASFYNYDISPFRVEEEKLRSSLDKNLHIIRINSAHLEYIDAENTSEKARDRHLAFLIAKERAQEIFERMVEENTALPTDYRLLTEIAAEAYYRAIKLMDIQE